MSETTCRTCGFVERGDEITPHNREQAAKMLAEKITAISWDSDGGVQVHFDDVRVTVHHTPTDPTPAEEGNDDPGS